MKIITKLLIFLSLSYDLTPPSLFPIIIDHQQIMLTNYYSPCFPWRCLWRCMLWDYHHISCHSSIALTVLSCPLALWSSFLSTWASCQSWASQCYAAYACSASSKSPGGIDTVFDAWILWIYRFQNSWSVWWKVIMNIDFVQFYMSEIYLIISDL